MLQINEACSNFFNANPKTIHLEIMTKAITPSEIHVIPPIAIKVTKEINSKSSDNGYIPNNSFLKTE